MIIQFSSIKRRQKKQKHMMNKDIDLQRKKEIENIISTILENEPKSISNPSIDIAAFVKKKGFDVRKIQFSDPQVTGVILVNRDDNIKVIGVTNEFPNPENEKDCQVKKSRFITAHEYAHYELSGKEEKKIAFRDTLFRDEPEELEADYFARAILMPLKEFTYELVYALRFYSDDEDKLRNEKIVEYLSDTFTVTKDKTKKRIKDIQELIIQKDEGI